MEKIGKIEEIEDDWKAEGTRWLFERQEKASDCLCLFLPLNPSYVDACIHLISTDLENHGLATREAL